MLSKTLAEEAAWKFSKENGIDMVVLNPGLVIGPLLQQTFNESVEMILKLINGTVWKLYSVNSNKKYLVGKSNQDGISSRKCCFAATYMFFCPYTITVPHHHHYVRSAT